MRLPIAFQMAKTAIAESEVNAWIHLDHGDSFELVAKCLDVGFDSVMIDASEKTFGKNIKITRQVVRLAEKYGACVEAELGYVAKLGQSMQKTRFTEPDDAKRFVVETGVHALAVAISSVHGFYKEEPRLDLERLSVINEITNAALVLHGVQEFRTPVLREAVNRGIRKVNLATEIKNIFMKTLQHKLEHETEIDLRKVFPVATNAVTELVLAKLKVVNSL